MSALNNLNEQLEINNIIDPKNNNEQVHDNDEKKQPKQALYKIVQHITMYGMREEDFYTLNTAVAHWESLTYLLASIWYQYDSHSKTWHIKDSYGTVKATQKIVDYINKKYGNGNGNDKANNAVNAAVMDKKVSIISYLTSFVMTDTDNDNETKESNASECEQQNIALLDEFFKFTEIYTKQSGIAPINNLNNDDRNSNDLIVSSVWSVGFQCYFLNSFAMAQQTWQSLGVWYSSVWFTRNAMGTFVVNDNFGTSDSVRKICRFVNEAQETWNYMKSKKDICDERPLNDMNDSVVRGKNESAEEREEEKDEFAEDDSKLCIVCLDGNRDHIIIPCGHICVCVKCKELYDKEDATCPMCRGKVEKVIKTFT